MQKIVCYVLLGFCNLIMAQQESLYTQYMYNTLIVNPAYTGSSNLVEIFALHRNQWVGFDGSPKTYNLALSVPLQDTNIALGINFLNEMSYFKNYGQLINYIRVTHNNIKLKILQHLLFL